MRADIFNLINIVPPGGGVKAGRGGGIRTRDPLRPRQVRYQTALRPDVTFDGWQ